MPHNPSPYDDDWEDQPAQGWFYKWVLGVALPLGVLAAGVTALWSGEITLPGRAPFTLRGLNATALGIAACSASLFLHCHYFWGNIYNQAWFAVLGKIAGLLGFIGGMGVVLVRVGVLWLH